mgnify:CR=1 FL=1
MTSHLEVFEAVLQLKYFIFRFISKLIIFTFYTLYSYLRLAQCINGRKRTFCFADCCSGSNTRKQNRGEIGGSSLLLVKRSDTRSRRVLVFLLRKQRKEKKREEKSTSSCTTKAVHVWFVLVFRI